MDRTALIGFGVLIGVVVCLVVMNGVIAGLAFVDEANTRRRRNLTSRSGGAASKGAARR